MRSAWLRLEVPKGHREELARLTGIPASNLSSFNTGRRPLTTEMAQRIVDAVPGLTLADLGARAAEGGGETSSPLPDRLGAVEAEVAELREALRLAGMAHDALQERVAALESARRVRGPRAAATRGGAEK